MAQSVHPLDNPVWASLSGGHSSFALGGALARRYSGEFAPFAGTKDLSTAAIVELQELVKPEEEIYLLGPALQIGEGWVLKAESVAEQLICLRPPEKRSVNRDFRALHSSDVPAMIELTSLVFPGYFRRRTIEMGDYFGFFENQKLAAMAGERFSPNGFREISGVCTHPDYQGRGLAATLIQHLVSRARKRGESSFLHVGSANLPALTLYEKLGFQKRCSLEVRLFGRTS